MLLTISTTRKPATDPGYILHKNPFRCQVMRFSFGKFHVFYPEVSQTKCTIAMLLDIDPIELVKKSQNPQSTVPLDKPLMGNARNARNSLTKMPLACTISIVPCRGGERLLQRIFEPLGFTVVTRNYPLDSSIVSRGNSVYHTVELSKETTVHELLNHLYVLVPVLDNQKQYHIDASEIAKLLKRGEGCLTFHPEKELIARRYLKNMVSFAREALERLLESNPMETADEEPEPTGEETIEHILNLNVERMGCALSVPRAADVIGKRFVTTRLRSAC